MTEDLGGELVEAGRVAQQAWEMVSGTTLGGELSDYGADAVRVRRVRRQIKALVCVKRLIDDAGLGGQVVPDRTLFPLLEIVADESDPDMASRWAGLLASASARTIDAHEADMFSAVLSQISPLQAGWIDQAYDERLVVTPVDDRQRALWDAQTAQLETLGLISRASAHFREGGAITLTMYPPPASRRYAATSFGLTIVGAALIEAVRGPQAV